MAPTPSSASSSRERSPPESSATGFWTSSPRNRKRARYDRAAPGVTGAAARRASSTRDAAQRAVAQLREVAGHDVATDPHEALERRELARDGAQQRGLASAVGTHQADAVAAPGLQASDAGDGHRGPTGVRGQVPAEHLVEGDDDLGRARGRGAEEARPGRPRRLLRVGAAGWADAELLQAPLVLVHLDVLALAAVALHELRFAGDGRRRLADHAAGPSVGRLALQEVGGVAAAERRPGGGRAAPRHARRRCPGRPGRARPPGARRGDGPGSPPATRAPRCPGGWWARRA